MTREIATARTAWLHAMMLPRAIFITGKGGAGKSTVAASLSLALARRRTVTLVDLDQMRGAARLLGSDNSLTNPATRTVSAREELTRFVERLAPIRAVARRMLASRTFGFVTAALPGLEAFLVVERLRLMVEEIGPQGSLVIDGPATGGAHEMLSAPYKLKRLAPRGALHSLALEAERFITDASRFGVWLTAIPEELAIREALSAFDAFRTIDVNCDRIVLNRSYKKEFSPAEIKLMDRFPQHQALATRMARAGASSARAATALRRAGCRMLELPMLFSPEFRRSEVESLANALGASLTAR